MGFALSGIRKRIGLGGKHAGGCWLRFGCIAAARLANRGETVAHG
jgi:hypothetical protein